MLFGKKVDHTLEIEGMTCSHCVGAVRDALTGVAGVKKADVSLDDGRAVVTAKEGVDPPALVTAVEKAGYEAHLDN